MTRAELSRSLNYSGSIYSSRSYRGWTVYVVGEKAYVFKPMVVEAIEITKGSQSSVALPKSMRMFIDSLWTSVEIQGTVGVEIECLIPISIEAFVERVRERGVDIRSEGYNHSTRDYWKIVSDASVGGRGTPIEIVSPVLTHVSDVMSLKIICAVLKEIGAKVNRTCGLHVHIGAGSRVRDVDFLRRVQLTYKSQESVIDQMVSRSRRGNANRFCKSISGYTTSDRYVKLNLCSIARHGTIEFRQHQGTVNFEKIYHWMQFCMLFVKNCQSLPRTCGSVEEMLTILEATHLVSYYIQRSRELEVRR